VIVPANRLGWPARLLPNVNVAGAALVIVPVPAVLKSVPDTRFTVSLKPFRSSVPPVMRMLPVVEIASPPKIWKLFCSRTVAPASSARIS
jgi:hypothetical protein